ncbi:TRAP-type C4-dicarboxylate transport system, substrate-binding protein [Yoonia tamlensis]|uniref:TRAP-type C4-dicarboxylate transport system, substrate-binding protein n=1 Tax=Yoonia tamlensis TaxID=390270 RepID=A0A1I6FPR0_9RHOB|nr:C4-dicarboxylate ABC transporter substrate-binding protein [Yoonia tamlensis]SFR31929.1 TRAP-type C4-dicarboxylate transport system, substrate-binding protein [Yoonia tamlensis]
MNDLTTRMQRLMVSTVVAVAAMGAPTVASADQITLESNDGAINITGELIEFADGNFVIESAFGPIRVDASQVTCTGDACPGVETGPIVWDVSLWGSRRAFTEHVEKLAELVSEKTDGEFTLNLSYGDLAPSNQNLDGIAAGDFEMAQFCAGYHPEKNPSITVLELPFLGVNSLEQEIEVSMAVYSHPATQTDLARWNATLLMPSPLPQYNLVGSGFPPTSLDDFNGMNVRATGGIGEAIASLGAIISNVPATDVSRAMETGFVDAVSFAPHAHMSFGTIEGGTWWTTNLNPGTVNCPVAVNTDALNALSPEFREALTSSVDASLDHYVAFYNGDTMDAWQPALRERGIMELTINDEIMGSIRETVAGPAVEAWITENTALGLPAQELYDLVQTTIAQGN